ncbi:MAG TPA: bifunctional UDP-sugar hydrolase/5'-nucleotidase [Bacillaceae bacterium]|nr:bifunctional UDP-sugar hydrolase/5'-nucleotidase [Paenibacillus bovis]HLU20952.1 bifunctional UDP-sugar hydrolase/5'-nucleotidase [Bacillaceae bacterium]
MTEKIHIYHTNDLHSHFENWPRIEAFINQRKQQHELEGEDVFLFDIGDFSDRFHPYTEATMGKGNTKLLNNAQYTAVTIGNNEGITMPHQGLASLYEEANFDVIVANLYLPEQKRPDWVLPYQIYETKKGTRIGVTAVTTYYKKLYGLLGWELSEPFTELTMQINEMKDKTDMIILLSHLGIHDDEKIAEQYPEIDLILGAHTHHYFLEGKQTDNAFMAAAGKYGRYVGYVQLEIQNSIQMEATLYETELLPSVQDEEEKIQSFLDKGKQLLNETVTYMDNSLSFSWKEPSPLAELLCEALHEWCNADCTLINSGVVLTPLNSGRITKYDLHQMLPHPINPCIVELSGAELKEILLHAEDESWSELPVIGLGFRGSVMGNFVTKGVVIDNNEVFINQKPLEPENMYKLATTDMFTFGKFFPEIQRSQIKQYLMPEFLRDILEWKLKKMSI